MSSMIPPNFVQDMFTPWHFMAERIKVIMKVVEKIRTGREQTVSESAWERRKQRGMDGWREGEEVRRRRKDYEKEGGCNTTRGEVKNIAKATPTTPLYRSVCTKNTNTHLAGFQPVTQGSGSLKNEWR